MLPTRSDIFLYSSTPSAKSPDSRQPVILSTMVGRVRSAINQPGPGDAVSAPDAIAILHFKLIFQKKIREVFFDFTSILPIAPAPQHPVPFVPVPVLDVVAVNDRVAMQRTADFGVPSADTKIVDHCTLDVGVFKDPRAPVV